jgi:hypothetical protein
MKMKRLAPVTGLLLTALLLSAAGQAASMSVMVPAAKPAGVAASPASVSYKNVRFLNPLPDTRVQAIDVAKVPYDPNEPPGAAPAHVEFRFSHYYPSLFPPASIAVPTVYVFSTNSFAAYKWDAVERSLESILHARPDLTKTKQLPILPEIEAGQVFHAQAAYQSFKDGRGISYLAFYAQDVSPVTANRLIYSFQGITTDGRYYLSAIFPVHVSFLPGNIPSTFDYNAFEKSFEKYLKDLVLKLDAPAAKKALTPSLALLNALAASVAIS